MLEFLTFPFIQKALIAGLIVGFILSFLGVFATLHKMSFFGDGLAHGSLAGIALALLTGFNPLVLALLFGVFFAAAIYFLERKTSISTDAIIGILFTFGMALGVIMMSIRHGYQPELISFLFGNILAISSLDLILMIVFSAFIIIFLLIYYKQLTLITFDRDQAWLSGIAVDILEFAFYILLAIAIVSGVKILGIILVSALLITPSTSAKLVFHSFKNLLWGSVIIGELTIMIGLFLSYFLNFPSGATIILVGTIIFFALVIAKNFKNFLRLASHT